MLACRHRCLLSLPLLLACALTIRAETVSFNRDVMAVLSKGGCNQGTCHGNLNGKGGFKLSLRGEDPSADFIALSRDQNGRRLNRFRPAESLLLQKPTSALPHEGGVRFKKDDPEYRILRDWIEQGMPADPADLPRLVRIEVICPDKILVDPVDSVRLTVKAHFADGAQRDVTRLTVYERPNSGCPSWGPASSRC